MKLYEITNSQNVQLLCLSRRPNEQINYSY